MQLEPIKPSKKLKEFNKAVKENQKRVVESFGVKTKPTHRYFCDACTGIAGVSNMPLEMVSITCQVCGKTQQCKKENWIKL